MTLRVDELVGSLQTDEMSLHSFKKLKVVILKASKNDCNEFDEYIEQYLIFAKSFYLLKGLRKQCTLVKDHLQKGSFKNKKIECFICREVEYMLLIVLVPNIKKKLNK